MELSAKQEEAAGKSANIEFILDCSAFTNGLGNIKTWIENDRYGRPAFYIPYYTIRELDFLKNGSSMTAINARESSRFMEKVLSSEDPSINSRMSLDFTNQQNISWSDYLKYKVRSPKIQEFSNGVHSTSNILHENNMNANRESVQYEFEVENEALGHTSTSANTNYNYSNAKLNPKLLKKASLPPKMKYLIISCIQRSIANHEKNLQTFLITEDLTTKIWCEAFGISCININEAITKLNANTDKCITQGRKYAIPKNTHRYKRQNGVLIEKYDSISYEPRGSGQLWVP